MPTKFFVTLLIFLAISGCAQVQKFLYRDQIIIGTGLTPVYDGFPPMYDDVSNKQPAFFILKWQIAQVIDFYGKSAPISKIRMNDGREGMVECGNYIVVDTKKNLVITESYPCKRGD